MNRPAKECDPDQEDVKITFAGQDAIHVRCVGGRLELTLSVAKLSKGARKWKDFQVRTYYRPEVKGRSIELARDGIVQLLGPRLSTGSQIALRGVFSKVFSQKTRIGTSRRKRIVEQSEARGPGDHAVLRSTTAGSVPPLDRSVRAVHVPAVIAAKVI